MAWVTSPCSSNRLARELSTLAYVARIVLEDLEAGLQLGFRLAEAAQIPQYIGAVHPSDGDVFLWAL